MAKVSYLIVITILATSIRNILCENVCKEVNPCVCELQNHRKIDISQVVDPKIPHFFLTDEINGTTYNFHGCTDELFNATQPQSKGSVSVQLD